MVSARGRTPVVLVIAALILGVTVAAIVGLTSLGTAPLGMDLPVKIAGQDYRGTDVQLSGTVAVAHNGCFQVVVQDEPMFAVWPSGYAKDNTEVVTAIGDRLAAGDSVSGSATMMTFTDLVKVGDTESQGRWATMARYCMGDAHQLVVLNTLD